MHFANPLAQVTRKDLAVRLCVLAGALLFLSTGPGICGDGGGNSYKIDDPKLVKLISDAITEAENNGQRDEFYAIELANLAAIHHYNGDDAEAERLFDKAASFAWSANIREVTISQVMLSAANYHFDKKNYRRAAEIAKQVLDLNNQWMQITRAKPESSVPTAALDAMNLLAAAKLIDAGQPDAAKAVYEDEVKFARNLFGEKSYNANLFSDSYKFFSQNMLKDHLRKSRKQSTSSSPQHATQAAQPQAAQPQAAVTTHTITFPPEPLGYDYCSINHSRVTPLPK